MDYYEEIKNELIENEITKKAKDYSKNKSDLMHYYNVGKLLVEAQGGESRAKYGDGLIKEYSRRLTNELKKEYSYRNLMSMRRFYILFKNEKVNALRTQLSWTHYRELHNRIKSNEYQRLDIKTRDKLIDKQDIGIIDLVKNPIMIRNSLNIEEISEKYLKKLILENISDFMSQLGNGYSFIKDEYKIKIGDRYNYIDKHVKEINHDKTIGIIICKHDNKLIMEYCSDKRIISREFKLV